ncbi:M48 family metalloprotease [Peristeroidobacter agariperforans]|uniref:M48 family metalloprotease n=1 Tax=Peristeroidobacter agariperforans TaxID=268404 RepID=UPI00101C6550|nr:M48 family metalloprotease [Peristeroidobacter agariperforans]
MKAVVACALAALVGASLADTSAASEVDTSAQQLPSVAPSNEAERSYLHHDYLFVEDESLHVAVQSVIDTLLAKQPGQHRPRLLIYSAENFSAAADIEGNILISTGTLRKLDSEDELAALLAHELAHVIQKHPSKKSFMQRFPVGVDSYSAIVAASDRLQKSAGKAEQSDTKLNQKRVAHSQNVSLFWSDILAPSWNRKDEQQADRLGLEMMQAAGYDPRAVVTLIAKLAEARVQRSQRMQALCDEMVAHEQKRRLETSSDNQLTQAAALEVDNLRGKGSEKLIREGFDELLKFSSPYSSNDERIEQIKQEFATSGRDMVATKKMKYRKQAKDNGELLNLDEQAIAGMSSLAREDVRAGIEALRQVATSKSNSPHFKLAAGAYYEAQNEPVKSDAAIVEWLATPRAPVIAFVLHADYQSSRQNYSGALATLDAGRMRLDAPVPFLPPMITAARLNKDEALAERLTLECKAAEQQSLLVKTANVFTGGKPTGVYAECISKLGRLPAAAQGEGGWLDRLKR